MALKPVPVETLDNDTRPLRHKRHQDWEPYDKITIELVPRLKTSGMSGDEWRTGVKTILWHKGRPIVETFNTSLRFALANVTAVVEQHSAPIAKEVIEIERHSCDQPSCAEPPVSRYQLKEHFSERGEKLDPSENQNADYYRQFCARHLYRGDCGREDSDDNYIVLEGPGPNESQERAEDESPAARVTVQVDSMDELPEAVERARKSL